MKKAILSPLCSGLVIPGLGQIINQNLKKGVCILSVVLVLFVAFILKLYQIIRAVLMAQEINPLDSETIRDRLAAEDLSVLWYLLVAFAVLWVYAVLDAYLTGKKIDQLGEGNPL